MGDPLLTLEALEGLSTSDLSAYADRHGVGRLMDGERPALMIWATLANDPDKNPIARKFGGRRSSDDDTIVHACDVQVGMTLTVDDQSVKVTGWYFTDKGVMVEYGDLWHFHRRTDHLQLA